MRFTNQKRNHPFKNIVISVIIFLSVAGLFNYDGEKSHHLSKECH